MLDSAATISGARFAAERLFGWYALRRVCQLDRLEPVAAQRATLLRLLRPAQRTRFGREHDFGRIRSIADYQYRVPIRDYEAFWHEYWQPAFPRLDNVTWPGRIPYFALSSGTTSGTTKYIPVSRAMLASNRRAGLTALAWFQTTYPQARLLHGRMFFLGGSTDLRLLRGNERIQHPTSNSQCPTRNRKGSSQSFPVRAGDLSGIMARELPAILRPFFFPPLELALLADWDRKLRILAERSARLPISLVAGVPSWLLALFERLLQVTGRGSIAEVWPMLAAVVHGGTNFDPYRALFRQLIGNGNVRFLDAYAASEGFLAAEDPRYQLLRLIPDHGLFFEFVPLAELGKDRPARHTVGEVLPGVHYAVVVTTCAGLWSYRIGDTVCFERRDPPLFRFTGRTSYFLSAFGEHLIGEEVERAVAGAAEATGAAVTDFHVGPIFPDSPALAGRHRYLIEFAQPPADLQPFAAELDAILDRLNEDYRAHRAGGLALGVPEIIPVRRGAFAEWLRARGRLGGQHKLPRMDNTGRLTAELSDWLARYGMLMPMPFALPK
jgi:GH3 auxin-responsive promoter